MENIQGIGKRIRIRRKLKGVTIKNLAEYTGLSVGYLSTLEQDKNSPTLDNLQKICEILDLTVTELISVERQGAVVIRDYEAKVSRFDQYNQIGKLYDFGFNNQVYECLIVEPGEVRFPAEWCHLYDEVCIVLEGQLVVRVENEIHRLNKGDALYVLAQQRHSVRNETTEPCVSFWVFQK
jgi:transcriptional regulator with XRE-family HTH domain